MRNLKLTLAVAAVMLVAALAGPQTASAGNGTWLNTGAVNENWTTASNWTSGTVPGATVAITGLNANADVATFNTAVGTYGTVGTPILIDSAIENFKSITFDAAAGNYFIGTTGGNPVYLSSGGTIQITATLTNAISNVVTETINAPLVIEGAGGTYTFTNNAANGTLAKAGILNFGGGITGGYAGATVLNLNGTNTNANTISGIIDNGSATSVALTKAGTGTWILAAANTYTGSTTVSGGTLQYGIDNAIATGGVTIYASATSTLDLGAYSDTVGAVFLGAGNITGSGTLTSTSGFTVSNNSFDTNISAVLAGDVALTKGGILKLTLTGANTYTGGTTVNAGTLLVSGANNLPTSGTLAVNAGGKFSLADGTARDTSTAALNLADGAKMVFDWNAAAVDKLTSTAAAITAGTVGISINPTNTPTGGPLTILNSADGGLSTANYFLANNTNYTATLAKTDTDVTITGYASGTALTAAYWKGGQVAGATSSMALSDGTVSNWATNLAGAATGLVPGSGADVTFSVTGGPGSYASPVVDADMAVKSITFAASTGAVAIGGSDVLTIWPAVATAGITANESAGISAKVALGAAQTWTVATAKTLTVSGVVSGANTLTKAGAGTLTLSGANTYGGLTTVSAGTLQYGADNAISTGAVTVNGATAVLDMDIYNDTVGAVTLTAGSITGSGTLSSTGFTMNNAGATSVSAGLGGAAAALTKSAAGKLTLSGLSATPANNYGGLTTLSAGTLAITNTASLSGGLTISGVSTLDLTGGSAAFGGAFYNSANGNTITIGDGQTLATNNTVTILNNMTVTGSGDAAWNVTAPGTTFLFSGANSTLNMSGLPNFTANLGTTGRFQWNRGAAGTLTDAVVLAVNSTITTGKFDVGNGSAIAANHILKLGTGTNIINADFVNIGAYQSGTDGYTQDNRSSGELVFLDSSLGSIKIRSSNETGRAMMNVANTYSTNTTASISGNVQFAGHNADLLLSTLTIGQRSGKNATNVGTFTFDTGTLDATAIVLGSRIGPHTTPDVKGTLTIGGGTVTAGTVTMATSNSSVSTTGDCVADLNISGGTNAFTTLTMGVNTAAATVAVGSDTNSTITITGGATTVGTTFTMGSVSSAANASAFVNKAISTLNISAGSLTLLGSTNLTMGTATLDNDNTATGTILITGGSLTVGGNIKYTNVALGTENNTVTLNGGLLDMTAGNIGASGALITFNAQSGTLQNLAQLNGGAGLTKTTGGTLILAGANAYTGNTTIEGGTLLVNGALGAGSPVSVESGGTLGGNGTIGGTVAVNGTGRLSPGITSTGTLTVDNNLTMTAGSTYVWQLGASDAADLVDVNGSLALASGWTLKLMNDGGTAGSIQYTLFTYDSFLGTFTPPTIDPTGDWTSATVAQDISGKRIYLTFSLPGDADGNGVVDAADYIFIKERFGNDVPVAGEGGDLDSSGTIDWADLQMLMTALAATTPEQTPEPATLGLLAIGALAVIRRRRKS